MQEHGVSCFFLLERLFKKTTISVIQSLSREFINLLSRNNILKIKEKVKKEKLR